jgi:flagellar protein FliS
MMNAQGHGLARYGAVNVTTATPGQIVVMLYDGLFRFLREAMAAMEVKDRARTAERTTRALAILEQLLLGLDRSAFPSLCDKLEPLYAFCMRHVVSANARRDPGGLAEVIRILTPLREAWVIAVQQVARESRERAVPAQLQTTG